MWLERIKHQTLDKIKKREILILILCLITGFALRFYTFDQKSLWMDEIYTFYDSRDDIKGQIKFYKSDPTYLHPPLFFILTHSFYPFTKPERDLRIIPLIFGTLSIPMLYLLARQFTSSIALPCTLSLTFMVYHISLSQDGRSYSMIMFLGMVGLYFFIKYLKTSKRRYLPLTAFFFSLLFYTSYSSIPFITLSQILWFYKPGEEVRKPKLSPFLVLNGLILLFCLPWVLFILFNYKGQSLMHPLHKEAPESFMDILYNLFHDWVPYPPLMIISSIFLILLPFFSKNKKNAFIFLILLLLPIGGLTLFCQLFNFTHFITSRYFINFLPIFFISIYLSITQIEVNFGGLKRILRIGLLFILLLIASNLIILPLYYRFEKEDKRGLVNYLKNQIREGDKIIVSSVSDIPGILYYFGIHPPGRHHVIPVTKEIKEYKISFIYQNALFTIYRPMTCCEQYMNDNGRIWVVVRKWAAKKFKEESVLALKGYFDGSFLNYIRFPVDASIYLFLWDPSSPNEKGIDMPIE